MSNDEDRKGLLEAFMGGETLGPFAGSAFEMRYCTEGPPGFGPLLVQIPEITILYKTLGAVHRKGLLEAFMGGESVQRRVYSSGLSDSV